MDSDEDGVRKTMNRFAEAWNRHDMDALAALFAADADFVNVGGRWLKGRQEIHADHAFKHATIRPDSPGVNAPARAYGIFRMSTFRLDRIEVRFIHDDVAVAHGEWTLLGDARTSEPRNGMMSFVVMRDRDHWVVSAAQNTEINRTVR